jgi:diaminohydroxyphosphoribosylaminopyrimidine deaminase/5-amino-6-(5-phosphoribosylamino)uracil reductase
MRAALSLARRGLGQVWPNPAVGCVLVAPDGAVVGRGWTQKGGRPHAEAVALQQAGEAARGGTAYVTLEPCAHHGQTPPCAEALVAAGLAHCVVAISDPDPRVSGRGVRLLRDAGIEVSEGLLAEEATELNRGFLSRLARGRPMVALKIATTMDGKIATAGGESRWITSRPARDFGHLLRAAHDAILVGSGTILADDPALSCRLPGLEGRSPVKIVFDRRGRLTSGARIFSPPQHVANWVVTTESGAMKLINIIDKSTQQIVIKENNGNDGWLIAAFSRLGELGLTRILVEGGATIATALLRAGVVDRLYWFRSAGVLGGGRDGVGDLGLSSLADMARFRRREFRHFGEDILEVLDLAA